MITNKLFNTICTAMFLLVAFSCNAQQATLKEGVDYTVLQAQSNSPKIEVIEFFSYTCPHCHELDPYLKEWEKRLPKDVVFYRIPAPGNPSWLSLTQTFYALEALGLIDRFHPSIFNAIHTEKIDLANDDALRGWLMREGVDYQKFTEARTSFSVQAKVNRARQLMIAYTLDSVPSIIVDGRYKTGIITGTQAVPGTLNKLIIMARQARQKK